ncbi:hypothetical protein BLM37_04690 [Candidatus Gracilibacteria bacterium GN02-873]|jgi:hypothetical protein|nr:hypothetical protein BLM37_04690 [Candidatus Gracilibacteria bacterium GN02-873]
MLEWYKNLSEDEQELFEEDLIGMLTAFTEYIKKEERISIAKQVIREIKGNLEKIQKNNSYFIRSFRTS